MKTRILKVTRDMPEWPTIRTAAGVIDAGGIVCFPTDTIYGLAAGIYCAEAVERLRGLKGRHADQPFVVMISDLDLIDELAAEVTPNHRRLIKTHWPGPLTIVFRASANVPAYLAGPDGTIALRIPDDTLTQSILRACGMPLAAPSANVKGRRPALCPEDVLSHFAGRIELLLDGGSIESPQPSTIVAVGRAGCRVIRQGKVLVGR